MNMTYYFIVLAILLIGGAFTLGVLYHNDKECNEAVESVLDPLDGPLPVWLRVEDTK